MSAATADRVGNPTAIACGICKAARFFVRRVLVCRACDGVDIWPTR